MTVIRGAFRLQEATFFRGGRDREITACRFYSQHTTQFLPVNATLGELLQVAMHFLRIADAWQELLENVLYRKRTFLFAHQRRETSIVGGQIIQPHPTEHLRRWIHIGTDAIEIYHKPGVFYPI